jgi:hypothetical protein
MTNHDELERLARAATGDVWLHVEGERISHNAEGWETWAVLPSVVDLMTGDPVIDDAEHIDPRDRAFIAAANPATILALLSANRKMREEPRVLAITLEGMQGKPAGMMTVGVQMTDGQKFDLIRTNCNAISHWHWARLPDAEARSSLTTQRGDGE